MDLHQSVITRYEKRFGNKPTHIAHAPGRVNLLGEHVDYNDGFVLPAAINLATWIAFSPSGSDTSTLVAIDMEDETIFSTDSIQSKTDTGGKPLSDWARYPAGVAWALQEKGLTVKG
ncbi:MAG TPA: galactokinase family protein, partial [Leptolinea sp.]